LHKNSSFTLIFSPDAFENFWELFTNLDLHKVPTGGDTIFTFITDVRQDAEVKNRFL